MQGMEQHSSTAAQCFTSGCGSLGCPVQDEDLGPKDPDGSPPTQHIPRFCVCLHTLKLSPYSQPSATLSACSVQTQSLSESSAATAELSGKAHSPAWQPQLQGIKKIHVLHSPVISPLGHFWIGPFP